MKKLAFVCLVFVLTKTSHAQTEFMHSLGGKYYFYANSEGFTGTGLLYSPRINITSTGNSSISVGTHLGLGFSLYSGVGGSSGSLLIDAPLVGEFNFGFGSTTEAEGGFGGYLGAGYGIHRVSLVVDGYGGAATLHGAVFTGGLRFDIPGFVPLDLGASYMLDLKNKDVKANIFGISLSYMFGLSSGY